MRAGNAEVAARKPTARSCVSNGRDILPDVDGQSIVAPRCRDILAALVSDQGGLTTVPALRCACLNGGTVGGRTDRFTPGGSARAAARLPDCLEPW
jgi:hypothetical protein